MVEGTGLENRRASNGTEGSNPSLSASTVISLIYGQGLVFIILAGHKLGNPRLYETAIKAYKKRNFRELTCFHSYFTRNPPTADNQKSAAPAAPQLPFPP